MPAMKIFERSTRKKKEKKHFSKKNKKGKMEKGEMKNMKVVSRLNGRTSFFQGKDVRMCVKLAHRSLCTDVEVVVVASQ